MIVLFALIFFTVSSLQTGANGVPLSALPTPSYSSASTSTTASTPKFPAHPKYPHENCDDGIERAHYAPPPGDVTDIEGCQIVRLHQNHTLDQHLDTIGIDLPSLCEKREFRYLSLIHGYIGCWNESVIHDQIRKDPGVYLVEHNSWHHIAPPNANSSDTIGSAESQSALSDEIDIDGNGSLLSRAVSFIKRSPKSLFWNNNKTPPKKAPVKTPSVHFRDEIHEQKKAPWNLEIISRPRATIREKPKNLEERIYKYYKNADVGVDAYVVDTGIEMYHEEFTEPEFGMTRVRDYEPGITKDYKTKYCPHNHRDNSLSDHEGHGTHVAATLGGNTYGVAKNVNLYSVKTHCGSRATADSLLEAFQDIADTHAAKRDNPQVYKDFRGSVINMSFSAAPTSMTWADTLSAITAFGIVIAMSVGNDNKNLYEPACEEHGVLCVGNVDRNLHRGPDSNWGKFVKVVAPGTGVLSADSKGHDGKKPLSGSSMACPHAAGLLAQMIGKYEYKENAHSASMAVDQVYWTSISDVVSGFPGLDQPRLLNNGLGREIST